MGALQRFEKRLGRLVEGSFAKVFRGEPVQPVEIGAALPRECDDRAAVLGPGRSLVPNDFVVELGPQDHDRLGPYQRALCDELAAMVREHAAQQGYAFLGSVTVRLERQEDVEYGTFRVRSEAIEDADRVARGAPPPAGEHHGPPPPGTDAWFPVGPPEAVPVGPPEAVPVGPPEAVPVGPAEALPIGAPDGWPPSDDAPPVRFIPAGSATPAAAAWRSSPHGADAPLEQPGPEQLHPAVFPSADPAQVREPQPDDAVAAGTAGGTSAPGPASGAPGARPADLGAPGPEAAAAPPVPAAPFGSNMVVLPAVQPPGDAGAPGAPGRAPGPVATPEPPGAPSLAPPPIPVPVPVPVPPAPAPPAPAPAAAATPATAYRHRLVLTGGTAAMRGAASRGSQLALPVTRPVTVVGRGGDVDLRLDDPGVSRRHVELRLDPVADRVEVVDLDSTNGVVVNGQRVRRVTLVEGDRIQLGHTVLVYRRTDG